MRDSMVFYKSFADAIMNLDDTTRLACYEAVIGYALNEVEPEGLSGVALAVFTLIRPQIDANNKRYENGKKGAEYGEKGGRPKKNPIGVSDENPIGVIDENPIGVSDKNPLGVSGENPKETPNENVNVNENVNENANDKKREKRERFTPPSVDDVRQYCQEMKYGVDPEAFVDFYTSKGWKVGNQAMKDWKSAVRTWEKRDRKGGRASPVKFDPAQYLLDKIAGGGFDD